MQFPADFFQATERELTKSRCRFDDAKEGLDGLLAQRKQRSSRLRLQTIRHGLCRTGMIRQWCRFSLLIAPAQIMCIACHRNQCGRQ